MKTNVFWGVVGAILVIWLILMYVVVGAKMSEYSEVTDELDDRLTQIGKFASKKASELPTPELKAYKEKYYERWQSNVAAAEGFFKERDDRFEDLQGKTRRGDWVAAYQLAYSSLEDSYREYDKAMEEGDDVPFSALKDTNDESMLPAYQKQWNIQRTIVEHVMKYEGRLESLKFKTGREVKGTELADFGRIRVEMLGYMPPAKHLAFVEALMGDDSINFEVRRAVMGKNKEALQFDLVQEIKPWEGQEPATEPSLRFHLILDALDWKPQTEEGN